MTLLSLGHLLNLSRFKYITLLSILIYKSANCTKIRCSIFQVVLLDISQRTCRSGCFSSVQKVTSGWYRVLVGCHVEPQCYMYRNWCWKNKGGFLNTPPAKHRLLLAWLCPSESFPNFIPLWAYPNLVTFSQQRQANTDKPSLKKKVEGNTRG